ncbi:hypothetical protein K491DRAFT_403758 [Lophiostoma macrostomum CBS 122681]|uniref:Uncharacterized protein n=1 Tax=Lophiostoma macrostomum CBS 122681 TaxID=1314788 RepID=A0A6A6TAX8_9PLEO|nr:hypothetical protein K491DRAFT_403758 [Lophiostoma macrostomum CBS 122681]
MHYLSLFSLFALQSIVFCIPHDAEHTCNKTSKGTSILNNQTTTINPTNPNSGHSQGTIKATHTVLVTHTITKTPTVTSQHGNGATHTSRTNTTSSRSGLSNITSRPTILASSNTTLAKLPSSSKQPCSKAHSMSSELAPAHSALSQAAAQMSALPVGAPTLTTAIAGPAAGPSGAASASASHVRRYMAVDGVGPGDGGDRGAGGFPWWEHPKNVSGSGTGIAWGGVQGRRQLRGSVPWFVRRRWQREAGV